MKTRADLYSDYTQACDALMKLDNDRRRKELQQSSLDCLAANESVLRALHACVIDMHTGGRRRVRTSLSDPDFGYRELPVVRDDKFRERWLVGDWLMDVEVSLESVRPERPGRWERVVRFWGGR